MKKVCKPLLKRPMEWELITFHLPSRLVHLSAFYDTKEYKDSEYIANLLLRFIYYTRNIHQKIMLFGDSRFTDDLRDFCVCFVRYTFSPFFYRLFFFSFFYQSHVLKNIFWCIFVYTKSVSFVRIIFHQNIRSSSRFYFIFIIVEYDDYYCCCCISTTIFIMIYKS